MVNKKTVLFVLKLIASGKTQISADDLTCIVPEKRQSEFDDVRDYLRGNELLTSSAMYTDFHIVSAYLSENGTHRIKEASSKPICAAILKMTSLVLHDTVSATIAAIVSGIIGILLTLYITGKL